MVPLGYMRLCSHGPCVVITFGDLAKQVPKSYNTLCKNRPWWYKLGTLAALALVAIPSYSARRALFDRFVQTRDEEERKEKRTTHKATIEGYKQLLDEAKEDIDQNTDYQTFKRKWVYDSRFKALDRKERESLLNERGFALKRSVEEEASASVLNVHSEPVHENKEAIFNEYIFELTEFDKEAERETKAKRVEEEKLKEIERALRKRKEREEQEGERVGSKSHRKEAIESYQALLVETIKYSHVLLSP
ncbi:pre-mRNA-processing protein 40C isoform X2 [Tanacetum coccineum]